MTKGFNLLDYGHDLNSMERGPSKSHTKFAHQVVKEALKHLLRADSILKIPTGMMSIFTRRLVIRSGLVFLFLILSINPLFAKDQKKQTLAVLEFEGYGVDQFAVKTLTDRFRSKAVADGTFRIMERGAMDEILKEQKFQMSGCTSDECIVQIGVLWLNGLVNSSYQHYHKMLTG